jgi:death-on-curing protein
MRFLSLAEVLYLHEAILAATRGALGVRDLGALESAVAQPLASFSGRELYPSAAEKAAALCFSLVANHPFIDGNKRTAHASMEAFLMLNGFHIEASVDDQEQLMVGLATGSISRERLVSWLQARIAAIPF